MKRESTSDSNSNEASAFDWFVCCVLLGLLVSLGVNGASYLWHCGSLVDLVGTNQQVEESIGFPNVFWSEAGLLHDRVAGVSGYPWFNRRVVEAIKYSAIGWNLVYGLVLGSGLGIFAIIFRKRFNRRIRNKAALRIANGNDKRNQGKGGFFQISMRGILLFTAVIALTAAVLSPLTKIDREPVQSSYLAAIGYSSSQTLEVQFQSGAVYRYFEVPERVYQELKSADSLGRYFSTEIRDEYLYANTLRQPHLGKLRVIYFLGPAYLFTFAMLLSQVEPRMRYTLTLLAGVTIICLAMSVFVRVDRNQDRVLLGLFVCWAPQFALFAAASFISFVVQAFVSNRNESVA